jgi:short-subunit dehydrogenase
MAREAAARGLNVVLVARRRALLDELAGELGGATRRSVRVLDVDLSHERGVTDVLNATADLDVGLFAACAGFGTSGPFLSADVDREIRMLHVNCRAVMTMTLALGRRMRLRGRGGIVLMGSLVGFQGVPRAAHYAATKAYVQSFAEGLGRELAPAGIAVLSSAPRPVASGFGEVANMRIRNGVSAATVARETLEALGRTGIVRPGRLSKLLEASLAPLPRPCGSVCSNRSCAA